MTVDLVDLKQKLYTITGTDKDDRMKKATLMMIEVVRTASDPVVKKEIDLMFNEYVLNDKELIPGQKFMDTPRYEMVDYPNARKILSDVDRAAKLLNCKPEETPMKIAKLLQELDSVKLELETLQKETHA